MPTFPVSQHHAEQFTANVELLLQQMDHRFAGTYAMNNYTGLSGQVVKQFGEVEFQEKSGKFEDTNLSELAHKQRWVFPIDYTLALPIEREDEIRTIGSIESPYAAAMAAAWNRKLDEKIAAAALGTAKTGTNGGTSTAHDTTNQRIAANATVGGTTTANTGLTIQKLMLAKAKFDAAEVEGEQRHIVVRSNQLTDMLNQTEVQSADYNAIKALVQGEINTYMGFTFHRYEGLTVDGSDIASVYCWVPSGIHVGMFNNKESRIAERADKNHITQIFMRGTFGVTRTQEKKVVEILCDQSP